MDKKLDWNKYISTAVKVAEEGIVMVENNGALPLREGTRVALFGRMQNNYYKSGTGSGGMVNVKHIVSIVEALSEDKDLVVDEKLREIYREFDKTNPISKGIGWGEEPWSQDEMYLDEDLVIEASSRNDVAIMVIARLAGEDRDNVDEKGAYRLTDNEEHMLSVVCKNFDRTIVLLNTGNIIDMSFVARYTPSSVLFVWQAGMLGARAIPNIILGRVSPSGHLPDTIAYEIEDYPSNDNFGLGDGLIDNYEEDVFVGYRFFETFARDKVLYPFGYGLSYTEFEYELVARDEDRFEIKVTNIGEYKGKAVPMMFVSCPQGRLGKPARELCGFAKTTELLPGASEILTIRCDKRYYASYDDSGKTGHEFSWVLEAGTYDFYLGSDVRDAIKVASVVREEDEVVETLGSALAPIDNFKRMAAFEEGGELKIAYEDVPTRRNDLLAERLNDLPEEINQTGDKGIRFEDVRAGKASMDEFIAQLDDEELSLIVRGEGMGSPKVATGTAGAIGGLSKELQALGVPACCCSDGPSGMRIDSGKCAFALPNGTLIASTFDIDLIELLFVFFGMEILGNEIDIILGPGMNIHRHPLNGRNFEYFSEDPLLTGKIAISEIRGLKTSNITACIKHFCVNNREKRRQYMSSNVSERALREIYLRGFEMAVKEGKSNCIMTVYNMINGTYGASNYDLTTKILRKDWGFEGIVMTDWWAFISSAPYSKGVRNAHSYMARAQNDLYMCCHSVERKFINETDTLDVLKKNDDMHLCRRDLQRCARNILSFVIDTPAMDRLLGTCDKVIHIDSPFKEDDIPVKADVYYDVEGQRSIDLEGFATEDGHDVIMGITVDKPGMYEYTFIASSKLSDIAQIPMTVFYTSIPVNVVTWNGSNGEEVIRKMVGYSNGQHAIIRLAFGAPGVKLKRVDIKFQKDLPDNIKWRSID